MLENLYQVLVSRNQLPRGLSFNDFRYQYENNPNFKISIDTSIKRIEDELGLSQPQVTDQKLGRQFTYKGEKFVSQEEENVGDFFGDFFGDMIRSWKSGWQASDAVDETITLMNSKFGSSGVADKDIQKFIDSYQQSTEVGMTDEMQRFNKEYEEQGGGVWGFVKGVVNNPGVAPQLFVSSMATLAGSFADSEELASATLGGAAAGGAFAGVGAVAGGIGALAVGMEGALTFAELLRDEVGERDFNIENVRAVLQDKKRFSSIYNKAVGRGVAIGLVETMTARLAGTTARAVRGAVKKGQKAAASAVGVGVEAVGGGTGEIFGRLAADQEMDVREIGFEAIGGTATAPLTIGKAAFAPNATYNLNNQELTGNEFRKAINSLDAKTLLSNKLKIDIKNDANMEALVNDKRKDALYDMQIDNKVKDVADRRRIVELEKKYASIKDQTSVSGNIKATEYRNEIKQILGKYGQKAADADLVLQGGVQVKKLLNLEDNLAKTEGFARLLNINYKEFNTDEEYREAVQKLSGETVKEKSAEGEIFQDPETGKQTIFINKEVARQSKFFTVGQHELLHGLLHETLRNNDETAIQVGKTLEDFIFNLDVDAVNSQSLRSRIKKYQTAVDSGQYDTAARYEEVVTLVSEALANNELKLNTSLWQKVVDAVRQFMRKHFNQDIEIKDAGDIINFIKDYNKSFEQGVLYKSIGRLTDKQLQVKIQNDPTLDRIIKLAKKRNTNKKSFVDDYNDFKLDPETRKSTVNNAFKQDGIDGLVNNSHLYLHNIATLIQGTQMYDVDRMSQEEIKKDKQDLLGDTLDNLIKHIKAYKPEKNNDPDAYINSFIKFKMGTAAKKLQRTETKVTEAQERKARQSATLETLSDEATATMADMFELGSTEQNKLNEAVKASVNSVLKDMTIGVKPKRSKLDLQGTFRKVLNKEIKKTIKKKPVYQAWLKKNFPTFFNDVNVETLNKRFRGDKSNPDLFVRPTGKRYSRTATSQPQLFEKQPLAQVMQGLDDYFINVSAQNVNNRKDKIVEEISNYMAFEAARKITSSPDIFTIINEIGITKLDEIDDARVEAIVKDTRDVTNIRTKLKLADLTPDMRVKYESKIIDTFKTYQPIDMSGNVSEIYLAQKKKMLATIPEEDRAGVEAFMNDREYMIAKPQTGLFVANVKKTHDKEVLDYLYEVDNATAPTTEKQVRETTNHAVEIIKSIPPQILKTLVGDKATTTALTFFGLKDTNMSIDDLPWTIKSENKYLLGAIDSLNEHLNSQETVDDVWDSLDIDPAWSFKQYAPVNKTSGLIASISKDLESNSGNNQQEIIDKYKDKVTLANVNNPKVQAYMQYKFAEAYKNSNVKNKAANIRLLQGTTNATESFVKALAKIKYIHVLNGKPQLAPTKSTLWGYLEHLKENANTLIDFNKLNLDYVNDKVTQEEYMKEAKKLANQMEISYNDTDLSVVELDRNFNKNLGQGDFKLRALKPKDLNNFINIETGKNANTELADKMFAMEENNNLLIRKQKLADPSDQLKKFKNYDKALNMANRLNPPEKGISILDFDDTLAKTKSNVLYTLPDGTKGKIDATAFAEQAGALEAAGAKFDFSEFSEVKAGKKGPFFGKALDLIGKFGNKDMFILTARPQDAAPAIQKFLKAVGLNIKLENIIGLEDGRPEAKAEFIVDKAAEGYNNFLFADDAVKNVDAVSQVLDSLDINGKVYKVKQDFRQNMDKKFNKILEQVKGIDRNAVFSDAAARVRGALNDKFWSRLFVPPGADDFKGLMYYFMGKGKQGQAHAEFFNETLFKPFAKATKSINAARQRIVNEYSQLVKEMPTVKKMLLKATGYSNFTYDQAIRVYLMHQNNIDIPGLAKRDLTALLDIVKSDPSLVSYADKVSAITRLDEGYVQPDDVNWLASTIELDLKSITTITKRAEFLTEWKTNKDAIFTPDNLNKIEAIYGASVRSALEDSLYRMEIGTNRPTGLSKIANEFTDWANGAVGNIMFFNIRSAVLQTISFANFVNWSDNNPYKYMKAVGNFPQFAKDFAMIWNSDFLKSRRQGLQTDVNASEIVNQAANSKNKVKALISYVLGKGYLPTQMGDSFAICMGGAGFYRNRVDSYLKQGLNLKEAESKAFSDMQETSEDAQQSARPDKISQQQASEIGRWILSFQNTPMQYTRIIKKAALDLANKRGDAKTNISKIIYYGALQNLIFTSLQNAIFALAFSDVEEDEEKEKYSRIANGMADTILRGTGIYGAILATLKNVALEFVDQTKKGHRQDHAYTIIEGLNLSPALGSKARKVYSATQAVKFNSDEMMSRGFHIDNPAYEAVANVTSAATNLPVDRALRITDNLREATNKENQAWQRIALTLGWSTWDLGIEGQRRKKDKKKKKKKGGLKLL